MYDAHQYDFGDHVAVYDEKNRFAYNGIIVAKKEIKAKCHISDDYTYLYIAIISVGFENCFSVLSDNYLDRLLLNGAEVAGNIKDYFGWNCDSVSKFHRVVK